MCKIPTSVCKIPRLVCKMPTSVCKIPTSECKIPTLVCNNQDTMRSLADSMDVREDPKEAKTIAASQLKDWTQLQPSPAPCVPRCFPSTVSALWWAGLGRDTPLEQMAKADLSLDSQSGQQQGEAESSVGPAPDDVSHVQVLVTGSLVMVGGALTLLQPDLWGQ